VGLKGLKVQDGKKRNVKKTYFHSNKKMLGCLGACLGQIWTNPTGLHFFIIKLSNLTIGFVHI